MRRALRLLFVCRIFDRGVGGVERMAILLMNAMVERGHEVSLFTWDAAGAQGYYPMSAGIRWHRLDMGDPATPAGWPLRLARMRAFRRLASSPRPDVVIAYQHGPFLFAALSTLATGIPVVLAERSAPDRFDYLRAGRRRALIFETMRLARAITVQFERYIRRYPPYLRARMVAIPNPVHAVEAYAQPGAARGRRTLLSVGRLSYEKNFSALLRAFALLSDACPQWRLRIVGEGEERGALTALADELGIRDRVSMDGPARDVSAEYRAADLFCLPSRWEGFPNAIAEAMAHGLPAVAFEKCAGVDELIVPGRNGQLAHGNGDADTLAAALRPLMEDAGARERLGMKARKIVEAYRPEVVFDRWERLFRDLASQP
jgi:GalNAc-alpha-(1->4)-GalNAc-alpha-(1->3)-diNAcBac-PP-undecaprenol alpha-1,4-N-acetyl-D-galactosaminyltransferase